MVLKMIQLTNQYLLNTPDWGRRTEERISGTAGRRKRGSWCGIRDRRTVAERAEMMERLGLRMYQKRRRAGPRSRGREAIRC